ncbi:restriction endonuclease subunit S [Haloactinomyces albus]|uniref:Type I restriction enzyme S subunit n=1 Tax=Haloactinomyces albus TaxID=1352928 RepID=A0AAE3ZFY2_9ACTN|nr:restriction endonuclease subunit S [Haloactinomyces albus]MDR7304218.1 type I restriction enzyme S subunit [Haloactinomyces albus]
MNASAKIGRVARTISGTGFPEDAQGDTTGMPFIKVSDLSAAPNISGIVGAQNYVTQDTVVRLGARIAPAGSVVFPKVGAALLKNTRRLLLVDACMDNNLMGVYPLQGEPRFWKYAFDLVDLAELSPGGPLPYVSDSQVRDLEIPFPGLEEQRRIADFLDVETSRIDKITAGKRASAHLLEERIDVVADNLIRGVHESNHCPSGYGPLGETPIGWMEGRLRSIECEVQTGPFGSQLHADDYIENGWPVINPANITRDGLQQDSQVTVSDEVRERLGRHILQSGDVVFARRGELGRSSVVGDAQAGWVCGTGSLRLRINQSLFNSSYLHRYLQIPAIRHYFQKQSVGSTMANLNTSILLSMPLLIPPFDEQEKIARECDREEYYFSMLTAKINRQLELLQERKQALITAAVTGQIDVTTAGRATSDLRA